MEITNEKVEQFLYNVLNQTEKGKVEIGDEQFGKWSFYVELPNDKSNKINNSKIALKIKNKQVLVEKIKEYLVVATKFYKKDKDYFELSDESFCEKLILDLFINATNFDLNNMISSVELRTKMLKTQDLTMSETVVGEYLNCDIMVEIEKNKSNLEGPYKYKIKLSNNSETFNLPSITFGKVGNEIYLYCVQGEKGKQTNKLSKQMDRHFRKANKDVDMEDDMLSQISVTALVSLTIFLAQQKMLGVKKVNAYSFMPLRYDSNLTAGILKSKTEVQKQEFEILHNRNQFNITNKFFNTLMRYAYHFNEDFEYDDIHEELSLNLSFKHNNKENIIYEIENSVLNYENTKEI